MKLIKLGIALHTHIAYLLSIQSKPRLPARFTDKITMIFWKTIIFSHTVIWVRCARMVFDETNHDKWERLQVECYITKLLIPGSTRRWWWLYDYGALVESYWKKTTEVLGDKNLSQWHFFDYTLHTYQPGKKKSGVCGVMAVTNRLGLGNKD